MVKKGELVALFILIALLTWNGYAIAAIPPPPPLEIAPPTYCDITNGGVEICDSLDNDCDGTVDEGVCSTTSPSTSTSSSRRTSSSSSSSSDYYPVIVRNNTNTTRTNASVTPPPTPSTETDNSPPEGTDTTSYPIGSLEDPEESLIFGLTPLRLLVFGAVFLVILVLLIVTIVEVVKKRNNSHSTAYVIQQEPISNGSNDISGSNTSLALDSISDPRVVNYISEMRRRGYKDEDIWGQVSKYRQN